MTFFSSLPLNLHDLNHDVTGAEFSHDLIRKMNVQRELVSDMGFS